MLWERYPEWASDKKLTAPSTAIATRCSIEPL